MLNNKYKKWYLVLGIFSIAAMFFGGSLAYWQWTTNEEQKTSIALTIKEDFRCDADGGGSISSGEKYLVPTDCTNSEYAIQRTVTVSPTLFSKQLGVDLDLWLTVNSMGTNLRNSENFKYALTTNDSSCTEDVVNSGSFKGVANKGKVTLIDSNIYSKTTTETYYLYIWLDKEETSSNTMSQEFDISLGGECLATTEGVEIGQSGDLQYKVVNLSDNNSNTLGDGFYTLSSYTCDNNTTLTFDTYSRNLTASNIDKCDLNFTKTSNPKLYDIVEIGDYISYTGNNGCSGDQCSGWNANQTNTDIYDNYGYCYSSNYKFYTYGWRVLHKTDNSVYIVSAGSPECVAGTSSDSTATIGNLNIASLNYCNTSYLSGGICDATTAHAFNGDDFYKFTSQYYGTANARYLYSYNDGGTYGSPYCYNKNGNQYCGYNNDIVDNNGYYWLGSAYSSASPLRWNPSARVVYYYGTNTFGVRPVLKLDSSILATGGTGTIDNPYTISERS